VLYYGVFCTVYLSFERAFGGHRGIGVAAGMAAVAAVLAASGRAEAVLRPLSRLADAAAGVPASRWLLVWLGIGCLLRLGWAALVPPTPVSDHLSYLRLAESLVERGEYWLGHTSFLRPPGVSLALVPLVALLGAGPWVPLVLNLLLLGGTLVVVHGLAARVAGQRVANAAVVLLAVWPNGVLLSGLASKELLLLLLLPAVLLVEIGGAARPGPRKVWPELCAGLLLGAAVLTQPTSILLVAAVAVFEWLRGWAGGGAARRLGLLVAGAALVVSPWTLRNYLASGKLLLVSANGGQTLWVANNPEATGGFVSIDDDRGKLDEITYDRLAFRRAIRWIGDNPGRFLVLAVRKQILFLGDDADGAYWSLKRGRGIGDLRYILAKGISNAYWVAVLSLGAVALARLRGDPLTMMAPTVVLMLPLLLQVVVFSITESGGRHHVATMAFIVILSCLAAEGERAPTSSLERSSTVPPA